MNLNPRDVEFITGFVIGAMFHKHEIDVTSDTISDVVYFTRDAVKCLDRQPVRQRVVESEMKAELDRFLVELEGGAP